MPLSNQSDLPAFLVFSLRKVKLKIGLILEDDLPKMTKFQKIHDLPRMAKSRKMTYRDWPNSG